MGLKEQNKCLFDHPVASFSSLKQMPCSDKTFEGSLQYFFVSTAYVYCLLPELNSKLKAPVQKSILFGITAGDFTLP